MAKVSKIYKVSPEYVALVLGKYHLDDTPRTYIFLTGRIIQITVLEKFVSWIGPKKLSCFTNHISYEGWTG